jgi:hypothetical protein
MGVAVQTNGWVYYDSVDVASLDWQRTLAALRAAAETGRQAARGWPARNITEKVSADKPADGFELFSSLDGAVAVATRDAKLLRVHWDLSQGGTDDPLEPEYAKVRAYRLSAVRGSGLTLYACSPVESEVPQLLAAVQSTSESVLRDQGATPEA